VFEFKTSIHDIPAGQLLLYYFVLFLCYLFFLRGVKLTTLGVSILLLFNQGFLLLIDDQGRPVKALFIALSLALLFRGRFSQLTKYDRRVLLYAFIFLVLYFFNYVLNGVSLLWAAPQFYKYYIPVALYFGIRGLRLTANQIDYYGNLTIKLMWFQVAFSVFKLMILGLRENIIGSISDTGGSIGITFAICGAIIYWLLKGKEIKGKDWWFMIGVLLLPAASNKRAIWLLYPIIISLLITRQISRQTLRKISYALILTPLIIYFGFRLNPTLNPERQLWGSFDPQYTLDYILSYSGMSTEKRQSDLAQGRGGASLAIISNTISRPLEPESLIGFARKRAKGVTMGEFSAEDYGLMSGTMISGIGIMLLQFGWPATIILLLLFLNMIRGISDKRTRNVLIFYVIWDAIAYSGNLTNNAIHSIMLVLTILIALYKSDESRSLSTLEQNQVRYR